MPTKLFLVIVRALLQYGVEIEVLKENVAAKVTRPKVKTDGYRTWTEDEIAVFEKHHPIGTKARLDLCGRQLRDGRYVGSSVIIIVAQQGVATVHQPVIESIARAKTWLGRRLINLPAVAVAVPV